MLAKEELNCFTGIENRSKNPTGNINVSSMLPIPLDDVKLVSKAMNATINDVVISAMSSAYHQLMKEKGDPATEISVVMPANIRFKFPKTRGDVLLENKFGAMPLTLPLYKDM